MYQSDEVANKKKKINAFKTDFFHPCLGNDLPLHADQALYQRMSRVTLTERKQWTHGHTCYEQTQGIWPDNLLLLIHIYIDIKLVQLNAVPREGFGHS